MTQPGNAKIQELTEERIREIVREELIKIEEIRRQRAEEYDEQLKGQIF